MINKKDEPEVHPFLVLNKMTFKMDRLKFPDLESGDTILLAEKRLWSL